MDNRSHGQLSLEYLLLTAAFFSVLLVFGGFIVELSKLGNLSADYVAAKEFSYGFRDAVSSLSLYGDGSQKVVSGKTLSEWGIEVAGNSLSIDLEEAGLQSGAVKKSVSAPLAVGVSGMPPSLEGEFELILRKESDGSISVTKG